MADGGRGRGKGSGNQGGKSINQLRAQQRRTNEAISNAIREANANGDKARVAMLNRRRMAMNNKARQYVGNINRSQRARTGQNATNANQKYARSTYMNNAAMVTRNGQVGQYRTQNMRSTAGRRHNQISSGARSVARGDRQQAARYLGTGNRSLRYGVRSQVRTNARSGNNDRSLSKNRRINTNSYNYKNAPIRNIIRAQRRARNRR